MNDAVRAKVPIRRDTRDGPRLSGCSPSGQQGMRTNRLDGHRRRCPLEPTAQMRFSWVHRWSRRHSGSRADQHCLRKPQGEQALGSPDLGPPSQPQKKLGDRPDQDRRSLPHVSLPVESMLGRVIVPCRLLTQASPWGRMRRLVSQRRLNSDRCYFRACRRSRDNRTRNPSNSASNRNRD